MKTRMRRALISLAVLGAATAGPVAVGSSAWAATNAPKDTAWSAPANIASVSPGDTAWSIKPTDTAWALPPKTDDTAW